MFLLLLNAWENDDAQKLNEYLVDPIYIYSHFYPVFLYILLSKANVSGKYL